MTKKDEFIEEVYGDLDFLTEEEVAVIAAEAYSAGVSDAVAVTLRLEDVLLAAATKAYEVGDEDGFIAGVTAGFEDGLAAGRDEGYDEGYADSQRELNNAVAGV